MSPNAESRLVVLAAVGDDDGLVLSTAIGLGRVLPRAELHVLHVVEVPAVVEGGYVWPAAELFVDAQQLVERMTADAAATTGGTVKGHVAVGSASELILRLAGELEADLVVVGSRRKGVVERTLMGSVSERVVRRAQCPVVVARPTTYGVAPAVEPPCPECLETRRESSDERMWCGRHAERHPRARLHYETPEPFALGSTLIRP